MHSGHMSPCQAMIRMRHLLVATQFDELVFKVTACVVLVSDVSS